MASMEKLHFVWVLKFTPGITNSHKLFCEPSKESKDPKDEKCLFSIK